MNAPAPIEPMEPKRERLRLLDVFFCRFSSPILAHVPRGPKPLMVLVASLLALIPIGWLYHCCPDRRADEYLVTLIFAWAGFEVACFLYGLRLGWMASRFERQRRISELTLTELRPIEIIQFTLARRLWPVILCIALVTCSTIPIDLCSLKIYTKLSILIPLIGINTILTLYMAQWMQAATFLASDSWTQAIRRQICFLMVYGMFTLWLMALTIGAATICHECRLTDDMAFLLATLLVLYPFWRMKYTFARAWAQRIEGVILRNLE